MEKILFALESVIPNMGIETITVRACILDDPRNSVEKYDQYSTEKKNQIYRLYGYKKKPNDNEVIIQHVKKNFSRPPHSRKDRYSLGINALYSSDKRETAENEVRYHLRNRVFKSGKINKYTFNIIKIDFLGNIIDIKDLCKLPLGLMNSENYTKCQSVGKILSSRFDAISARSVRSSGQNQITYNQNSILSGKILGKSTVSIFSRRLGKYSLIRRH